MVFGEAGALVGVWSEPRSVERGRTAVVMVNSGVIHHVGVWRLHVRLARTLAGLGVPALRFDLSGIGDSTSSPSASTLEALVQQDVDSALEYVRSQGPVDQVVLVGLCSGARDALDAAGRRPDVAGIVCVDLIADFRTWHHHAVHYRRRFFRPKSWANTLSGRNSVISRVLSRLGGGRPRAGSLQQAVLGLRPVTGREILARELDTFLGRGGRVLFVFSGGLVHNYNHRLQFRRALPVIERHPRFSLEYFGGADHTFSRRHHQQALMKCITSWLSQQGFAPGAPPPAAAYVESAPTEREGPSGA